MKSKVKLSEFCKNIRNKSGLSKVAFSEKIGISDVQVGKIEHGMMDNPTPLVLYRIYAAYGMSLDDIENCIDFTEMGPGFIPSFKEYVNRDIIEKNNSYLIELFTNFLEKNGFDVIYPDSSNWLGNYKNTYTSEIEWIDRCAFCAKGIKSNSNNAYGYIVSSNNQIKSKKDELEILHEIDNIVSIIIHPRHLIYEQIDIKSEFVPGLKDKKFAIYFITGSKSIYDFLCKLKNTYNFIEFEIYCFYSRYKNSFHAKKLTK